MFAKKNLVMVIISAKEKWKTFTEKLMFKFEPKSKPSALKAPSFTTLLRSPFTSLSFLATMSVVNPAQCCDTVSAESRDPN